MKSKLLTALFILVALPSLAFAQAEIGAAVPSSESVRLTRVEEYTAYPDVYRNPLWWQELSKEINLGGKGISYKNITSKNLQPIIFFASVHGDKVDFRPTVPVLVDVYRNQKDEALRIMAVAALHAIADEDGMEALRSNYTNERSELVKHVMTAALVDYHRQHVYASN